jgi:hypothetical protein
MIMKRIAYLLSLAALGMTGSDAAAVECGMPNSFDDPKLVLTDGTRALFWVRPMEVNVDGAPNAYHRDDPHGNKGKAIEFMGNGMTIKRGRRPSNSSLRSSTTSNG